MNYVTTKLEITVSLPSLCFQLSFYTQVTAFTMFPAIILRSSRCLCYVSSFHSTLKSLPLLCFQLSFYAQVAAFAMFPAFILRSSHCLCYVPSFHSTLKSLPSLCFQLSFYAQVVALKTIYRTLKSCLNFVIFSNYYSTSLIVL